MTRNSPDTAQQAVETVVKSPELVEQILSDESVQVMIAQRFHSGPLPSPSDLAQYNAIIQSRRRPHHGNGGTRAGNAP